MNRRHVYRPGDLIRVVDPRFVARVGYPETVQGTIEKHADELLAVAVEALGKVGFKVHPGRFGGPLEAISGNAMVREVVRALAYAKLQSIGFGGEERSIHFEDAEPRTLGMVLPVEGKRVVRTGFYSPGDGGDWGRDIDPTFPGLDEPKTHVLLVTGWGLIPAAHVELVEAVPWKRKRRPKPPRVDLG